jgi:hypothetical protein
MIPRFCSYVDDVPAEASAIIHRFRTGGFPLDIQSIFPTISTASLYAQICRAHPSAAIIDFKLSGAPRVNSEVLGMKLKRHAIPTVFITKDRNVVDEGPRCFSGFNIPVFHKQRLITEPNYLRECVLELGLGNQQAQSADYGERLTQLEELDLIGKLTSTDRKELAALRARAELEDAEESARVNLAHKTVEADLNSLMRLIRKVTKDLKGNR